MGDGNLGDATIVLRGAVETGLFPKSDPCITNLLTEIEKKQAEATTISPHDSPSGRSSPPRAGDWTAPTCDPSKDYVYHQGEKLLPEPPPDSSQVSGADTYLATNIIFPPSTVEVTGAPVSTKHPYESTSGRILRNRKVATLLGAFLLVLAAFGIHRSLEKAVPSQQEIALQTKAENLRSEGRLRSAIDTYHQLINEHGALEKDATTAVGDLEKISNEETDLYSRAQAAENKLDYSKAKDLYGQVASLNGDRRADAENAIKAINGFDRTRQQ
jgi:hypothetical protein